MSSIVDQLADLINPNPSFDPEDDINEGMGEGAITPMQ